MRADSREIHHPDGGPPAEAGSLTPARGLEPDYRTRAPNPARGVIARPRLEAMATLVLGRALTLVMAPPGYGKTCVALSWHQALAGQGVRVAWLRLTAQDDDVERFLGGLAITLRRACDAADLSAPPWWPGDVSIPVAQRMVWLLEWPQRCAQDVVLFIDDAHTLQDPSAQRALQRLVSEAPDNLRLVLISRNRLALPLASLLARDAVLELTAQSLCFDLDETHQLLRRSHPDNHSGDAAARLLADTGGWIAALRASLLMQRMPLTQGQRHELRPVQALFAELIDALDARTRHFLEAITVTERICPDLAAHLSGDHDAAARLDQLEQRQLFLGGRDVDGWFEFHRLFRDFVQRRLRERDAQGAKRLHAQAAQWYAGQSLLGEAIGHALSAGDPDQALCWIERHAMNLVGSGGLLILQGWERQLRTHLVQSPRRLRLAFAWALGLAMACDRALALLDGVEAELDHEADQALLRNECLALRAVIVTTTGDYELGAELAARVRETPDLPPWAVNAVRNVLAAGHLHHARWRLLHGAAPLVGHAADSGRPGDAMSQAYRLSIQGVAEYRQGHLEDAAALLQRAMDIGAARGNHGTALQALPAPTLALVHYEQNRVAQAALLNASTFEINRRIAPIEGLYAAYLIAARTTRLNGHAIRARHLLEEGEAVGSARGWRRAVVVLRLERLRHCLLDGRAAEAAATLDSLEALAQPGPGHPALECRDFARSAEVARAWVDLAAQRPDQAAGRLQTQWQLAAEDGRQLDALTLGTGLALSRLAIGQTEASLELFARLCRQAAGLGAVRCMVDQPVPLRPLLQCWDRNTEQRPPDAVRADHLRKLCQACDGSISDGGGHFSTPHSGSGASMAGPSAVDQLSPRERHILQRMAQGESNKEIARSLQIAPETVKTHVSKIFVKLGASNRAQAVTMLTSVDRSANTQGPSSEAA